MLPPSHHASGGSYRWIEDVGSVVEVLPQELLYALVTTVATPVGVEVDRPSERRFTHQNPCPVCHAARTTQRAEANGAGASSPQMAATHMARARSTPRSWKVDRIKHLPPATAWASKDATWLAGSRKQRNKVATEGVPPKARDAAASRYGSLVICWRNRRRPSGSWVVENLLPTGGLSVLAGETQGRQEHAGATACGSCCSGRAVPRAANRSRSGHVPCVRGKGIGGAESLPAHGGDERRADSHLLWQRTG